MSKQTDPFEEQAVHFRARQILRKHYNDEVRRAAAAHLDVEYAQSQIDYDKAHRPENTKDIPRFEKKRDEAAKAMQEHEADAMALRDALKALGEVFTDDEAKRGNGKEQQ